MILYNSKNLILGRDIYHNLGYILRRKITTQVNLVIITDHNVAKLYLKPIAASLATYGFNVIPIILKAGEASKSFNEVQNIIAYLIKHKIRRNDFILALGGGMIGDLAGFIASIYLRGIGFINITTSLLAQIDASIGGKTAINIAQGKNLIGSFYDPYLIISDIAFLKSLEGRQLKAGYAEMLKYGLIDDKNFFIFCQQNYAKILNQQAELEDAIKYSITKKLKIVSKDKFEQHQRMLLNLGHSFAHALESYCGYNDNLLLHGEAVAIGIVLAFQFSHYIGLCAASSAKIIIEHLQKIRLAYNLRDKKFAQLTPQIILKAMSYDKKNQNNHYNLILARDIGQCFVAKNIEKTVLESFFRKILDKKI